MDEKEIKVTVGDVILKTSFVELLFSQIKKAIPRDSRLVVFEDEIEKLENLRKKFAHGIVLINPVRHPGEIFLSKIEERKESSWFNRKDGERVSELYASFSALYEKIKDGLDKIVVEIIEKSEKGNSPIPTPIINENIIFLTSSEITRGTAVAEKVFLPRS